MVNFSDFSQASISNIESMSFFRLPHRIFLAILLTLALPATAAEWLLASHSPYVKPGDTFELFTIVSDHTPKYDRLRVRIESPRSGQHTHVEVELIETPSLSTPSQRRYVGRWPADIHGMASLSLLDMPSSPIIFDATQADESRHETLASAQKAQVPQASIRHNESGQGITLPTTAQLEPENNIDHDTRSPLTFHEPVYFVFGGKNPTSARFQLSFSYRLFDRQGIISDTLPFASGLYFAYTQTSLWDLESDSKPFRDTSFRPSFFYKWEFSDPDKNSAWELSSGYEHESNGKSGNDSRSIDTLFLRADALYQLNDKGLYFGITPKIWHYLDKEDNPDIHRYRGYGQLGLRLGYKGSWQAATLLRAGTDMGKRSVQVDVTYPLKRRLFSRVGTLVHFQYFQGYGQTMLGYNHSDKPQFRLGFSIAR